MKPVAYICLVWLIFTHFWRAYWEEEPWLTIDLVVLIILCVAVVLLRAAT